MEIQKEPFNRKRINYLIAEDFYLATLVSMVILTELKVTKNKPFNDYTKIAYLIEFVLNSKLIQILESDERPNSSEKDLLLEAFGRGEVRLSYLSKIGLAMEKKGYLGIGINTKKETVDWFLQTENVPTGFYDKDLFSSEIENAQRLIKRFPRIRTVSSENIKDNLFKKYEIIKWHD